MPELRRELFRERIIEEATKLFSLYGFRRTSVDAIAAAAEIAKPTLYTHFRDKDDIFIHVVYGVLTKIKLGAKAAAEANGTIADRLAGMLSAKFTFLFQLIDTSPHAAELLSSTDTLSADYVKETDRAFLAMVKREVELANKTGELDLASAKLTSKRLAEMLLRCGHGAGFDAETPDQHRKNLRELVETVLAGARKR